MENLVEVIRPMGNVMKVLNGTQIDNVQALSKIVGYTDYVCWAITETLKKHGLLEDSTPFKLTSKGVEVLQQL